MMDSLRGKDLKKFYTIGGFIQVLQAWIYYALPDLATTYGKPIPNKLTPPFLAYNSGKRM